MTTKVNDPKTKCQDKASCKSSSEDACKRPWQTPEITEEDFRETEAKGGISNDGGDYS